MDIEQPDTQEASTSAIKDSLDVQVHKVAALLMQNESINAISKQLGISRFKVQKIADSDQCKGIMTAAVKPMLEQAKRDLGKLTKRAVEVIEEIFNEGGFNEKLQAAKIVLKAVGLEEAETKQSDTSITIVMPGFNEDKTTIVVQPDGSSDEV